MLYVTKNITESLNQLEEIYTSLRKNNITLSKTEAMKIVGGRGVLERLVSIGKIRMKKRKNQFGKWDCIAEDVLRYANFKERQKHPIAQI